MRVTTERLDNCQANVIIELDAAEIDKKLRQTARTISRQFNVPGYRRGRAPFHAVIRVFGREAVQQQALEDFGQELYDEALKEIEYEPYEMGELQDVEWDPFRMTILLPIEPEVDLGDYRSVRVPFEPEPVTDERIEEYLEDLRQEHGQWVPVERPAAMGDQVVLDMKGIAGADEIMNNEDYEMLLEAGVTYPLPGFHEEIVGMSPGEEKSFVLAVPEDDSDESAAGQEAAVTVRVHTVREQDLPPLDDELAMMVGDYDTLDDLRVGVRENLETEAMQRVEAEYLDRVLEAMSEVAVKIEYPPQAVDRETDLALSQMERNLASSGMKLETFLGMIGKTRESYKQELRPSSEERLRKRVVLNKIVEQEVLKVEPEEVDAEISRMGEMAGAEANQLQETLNSPAGRLMVADDLLITKAQDRVVQIAKGEAPALEQDEAESEAEAEAEAEGVKAPGIESVSEILSEEEEEEVGPEIRTEEPTPEAGGVMLAEESESGGEPQNSDSG